MRLYPILFLLTFPLFAQLTFDPANPPAAAAPPTELYHEYTGTNSHQKGPKTVLVFLVQPSDGAAWTSPKSFASLDSELNSASQNYYDASYHQTWFGPKRRSGMDIPRLVVTPVLILPKTAAQYLASFSTLQTDCLAASRAQGGAWNGGYLDPNNYDRWVVMSNTKMISSTGLAYVGGRFSWTGGSLSGGVAVHELGHNWGVYHANDWIVPSGEPPRSSAGSSGEYQDGWDVMGGGGTTTMFNPQFRENLGFLERSRGEALDITASGTYRLYDYVHSFRRQDSGTVRALVIPMSSFTDNRRVILGFGHHGGTDGGLGRSDWNRNAVTVHSKLSDGSNRIDTTPGSRDTGDANDSSIKIGRTYSEGPTVNGTQMYGGFHVTPVARSSTVFNGNAHEWIDVVVHYQNSISNNQPPVVSFPQQILTGAQPGQPFNLSVTASDPNGDTLAFDWDFGDDSYNLVSSSTQTKTWAAPGAYLVRCTVSDMKGGTASAQIWVLVGNVSYLPPENVPTMSGLHYRAYAGSWSSIPNFDILNPVAHGTVNGFSLAVRPSNNNFAMLYTGYLDVPEDNVYQFEVRCDDGARLFIGGQLVVDNDGVKSSPISRLGTIALQAGKHPIRLEYFNRDNTATLQVNWFRIGPGATAVPNLNLVQPTWAGNAAPSVQITSPSDNEEVIVNSDVTVTAEAFDDGAVSRVVIFANGGFLAQFTEPPYTTVWPKVSVGTQILTAIAYDNTGRWTRSAPVALRVVSPPPTNGIGINFGSSGTLNTLYFNEETGAVYAYRNWNNFAGSNQTSPLPLNDHNGTLSPATVAYRADGAGSGNFSNNANTGTAPGKMMVSGLYRRSDIEPTSAGDLPNPWARVENVPYAAYDVYIYVDPPETAGEDTSAQRILLTPSEGDVPGPRFVRNSIVTNDGKGDFPTYDLWTGFREATATSLHENPDRLWGNYVVFRNQTAPSFTVESTRRNGTTIEDGTNGRHGRYLNAIQIIETVPTQPGILVRQTGGNTQVSEQGTTDAVTVSLAYPPTETVTVTIHSGTQLTVDQTSLAFTPANWNVAQVVTVGAVDDSLPEGPHTAILLFTATGGNYSGVDSRSVLVEIEDNDQAGVSVTANGSLRENNAQTASFLFTRSNAASFAAALTVSFQMSGTASFSGDYTLSGSSVSFNTSTGAGTVVIPAGQAQTALTIAQVNNSSAEFGEQAVLNVLPGTGYSPVAPVSAAVFIADDDVTDYFTEIFNNSTYGSRPWDLNNRSITFTPSGSTYTVAVDPITAFPSGTNSSDFTSFNKSAMTSGTASAGWWQHDLAANFTFHGISYSRIFVNTEGAITFNSGTSFTGFASNMFGTTVPKIAPYWTNLDTNAAGNVQHRRISDGAQSRTVIFYSGVRVAGTSSNASFQAELFDDGRIRFSYLTLPLHSTTTVVGLATGVTSTMPSSGYTTTSSPRPFYVSDFSIYPPTPAGNRTPYFTSLPMRLATAGQSYSYTVVGADPDPGQSLQLTAPTRPGWLGFTDHGNRTATLSGTPSAGGTFPVVLQVSDGTAQAQQSFNLLVVPAGGNTAPVFTSSPGENPVVGMGDTFTYAITTLDADGHTVNLEVVQKPGWLQFTPTGNGTATFSGVVPNAQIGEYPVSLVASDGLTATGQSFVITVNRAPALQLLSPANGVAELSDRVNGLWLETSVTDDGRPAIPGALSLLWTQLSGPGSTVFSNPSSVGTFAQFPVSGVYRLRLTADDGALSTTQDVVVYVEQSAASALASGLMGFWRFNEESGTSVADDSGGGRPLTLTGTYTFGPGLEGNALIMTASGSTFGETTLLSHSATPQMTWSAWVRADASPNTGTGTRAILNYTDSSGNARGRLGLKPSSSRLLFQSMHSTAGVWETGSYNLPANEWVHVTLTYNNSSTANHPLLYVNGTEVALTRTTAPSGSFSATDRLRVGGRSGTAGDAWSGRIDDVRVYNRLLAPGEIEMLLLLDAPNQAPQLTAALRDPIEAGANTGVLQVTVSDDGLPASPGEITTLWTQVSGPGTATFADPSALETSVSFDLSGTYLLRVSATDGAATSSAELQVEIALDAPVATRVAVSPADVTIRPGTTQSFSAQLFDQYERLFNPQPSFAWSAAGGGTINSAGLFTAGGTEGGPHTVTATAASVSGTASVTVFNNPPSVSAIPNQILAVGRTLDTLSVTIDDAETPAAQLTFTATSSNTALLPNVNILAGGTGSDRTLALTPAAGQTGASTVTVTVSDGHKTTTRQFTLTVQPRTAAVVRVTPAQFSLPPLDSGAFSAVVLDQVEDPVVPQPAITWSVSGGGSISATGVFTAGASSGGPFTVTATAGALLGTAQVILRAAGAFAWTGAAGSDWHNPANWSGFVPGPSDWAVFDAETANQPVISGTARVMGLRFRHTAGPVDLSGGTLEIGAGGFLNGGQIRGTVSSGTPNVTGCDSLLVDQIARLLAAGETVSISGTHIPAGTTVASASGTSLVMSQNATGSATNTYNLNAPSTADIRVASNVALTAPQAWQFSQNGTNGAVVTVSGNLSGSAELRIGSSNNSNAATLPFLRLTGSNAAYTGTIAFSNPLTQGSAGLLLGSAASMTGGLIHLESPTGQNYNLWLTGGPDSGTYTFGINGTQSTGARVQTRNGPAGLYTTGGTVAWDPGAGANYTWSAASGVTYLTVAGTDHNTPGPLALGNANTTFVVSGGNKTLATGGGGNHRGMVRLDSALSDGNEGSARTLTSSLRLLELTRPAVNLHASSRLNLTLTGGAVAVSNVNQLPGGNLNLNGGMLILDGITWEQFTGARAQGSANNQWQAAGSTAFGARGSNPLVIGAAFNADVASLNLGSAVRDADGVTAYANAPVRITQNITYSAANRTIQVAGTLVRNTANGTYTGFESTPIHEFSGILGGLGGNSLILLGLDNASVAEGHAAGVIRLSGQNTFTGTVLLGASSLTADTTSPGGFGVLVVPTDAAFGNAANLVVNNSNSSRGWAILLEDPTGTGRTFARNFRYDVRGGTNTTRTWALGAFSGQVTYTGTLTLQNQSGQTIANNTSHNLNLHAEAGTTLILGAAGTAATLHNTINSANTANVTTAVYRKTGEGTAVLRNVSFTGANANTPHYFEISVGNLVEEGSAANNAIGDRRLVLNGGVLETSGEFTRALGTGTNQLQWFSGGFAARGGPLSVNIAATAWGATHFLTGPLVLGSITADDQVLLENNLGLANSDNLTVTRTIRVVDNPLSPNDRAVMVGNIRNRADGADGGTGTRNLIKSGDGILELAGANNDLVGTLTVEDGTLWVSGRLTAISTLVQNGGALGGTGSIQAPVAIQSGGMLTSDLASPASEHVRLTLGDSLSFAPGAVVRVTVSSANIEGTYILARAVGGISGPLPALVKPEGLEGFLQIQGSNLQLVLGAPPNTAPTISPLANRTLQVNGVTGPISFTVGDAESAADTLLVTAQSSNTALLPPGGIVLGGSGASRSVSVTPQAGQTGAATVTLIVSDGDLSAQTSFSLTVLDPFAFWADTQPGLGGQTGPLDDPDGDGVVNLLEFAFGLNPAVSGRQGLPAGGPQFNPATGKNHFTISYRQRRGGAGTLGIDYTVDGIRYVVESSGTLSPAVWTSGSALFEPAGSPVDNGDGTDTVTVRMKTPVDQADPQAFLRVSIILLE